MANNSQKGIAMPKTLSERQAALREKRRKEGLIRVELWINPLLKDRIKEFIAQLTTAD